jgi:acetylornithine deacetylase
MASPLGFELDEAKFVALLGQLIGEARHVQNAPPKLVPREDLVLAHVLAVLEPHGAAAGGPLRIERVAFKVRLSM